MAVNQAYAALYGCRRSDVLGQTLTQTRHILGPDLEPLQHAAAELDQGGARARRMLEAMIARERAENNG